MRAPEDSVALPTEANFVRNVDLATVPSFSTGATFLDANAQAHHKPLSAFGDLSDNGRESGAGNLCIDVEHNDTDDAKTVIITMTDDGRGMSEHRMRTGIGGIAHSDKSHRAEVHYGMGAKSALPRLSPSSLVFTKNGQMCSVAMVSTTLSRKLNSHELKVPIATWTASCSNLLPEAADDAPLTYEQRVQSLDLLLEHTPFKTQRELCAQFHEIPGETGTRLVLYECDAAQFDVSTSSTDIRISGGDEKASPHDVSLREYLTVLYFADAIRAPPMRVHLRGKLVPPRNWTDFLCGWPKGQPAYQYTPLCLSDEGDRAAYGAEVRFGTKYSIDEVYRVLSGRRHEDIERKSEINAYSGVFYYNHDRLIMALEQLPKQLEASRGNKMMTTEKSLTVFGTVVVGVCREGFLTPEHNKAGYEAKSYKPNVFAQPQRPSFQDLHKKQVNDFFKTHLAEVMTPAFVAAKRAASTVGTSGTAQTSHALPPPPDRSAGRSNSHRATPREVAADIQAPAKAPRGAKRKATAEASVEPFEEHARYRIRRDESWIGEGIKMSGSGHYAITRADGKRSPNVRLDELELVGFEPTQLPNGFVLASCQLDGTLANVTWERGKDGLLPMMCRLVASSQTPGALVAHYFDGDAEEIFVALRPSDGACVAFGANGKKMTVNPSDMREEGAIYMDVTSIERAAWVLRLAPPKSSCAGSGGHGRGGSGAKGGATGGGATGGALCEETHREASWPHPQAATVPSVGWQLPASIEQAARGGSSSSSTTPEAEMHDLLKRVGLLQYEDMLLENGYDDVSWLPEMTDAQFDEMAQQVSMTVDHLIMLKAWLRV